MRTARLGNAYPLLNVDALGVGPVAVAVALIAVLMLGGELVCWLQDRVQPR